MKEVIALSKEVSKKETVKEKEKEEYQCKDCRYYDVSTQRIFVREHVRVGLKETRAICRAPKDVSKAGGHLVMRESVRPCFVKGVYVPEKVVMEKKKPGRKPKPKEPEPKPEGKTVVILEGAKKTKRLVKATQSLTQGPGYVPKVQEVENVLASANGRTVTLVKGKNGHVIVKKE